MYEQSEEVGDIAIAHLENTISQKEMYLRNARSRIKEHIMILKDTSDLEARLVKKIEVLKDAIEKLKGPVA